MQACLDLPDFSLLYRKDLDLWNAFMKKFTLNAYRGKLQRAPKLIEHFVYLYPREELLALLEEARQDYSLLKRWLAD